MTSRVVRIPIILSALLALLWLAAGAAFAQQDRRVEIVRFPPGASGTTINGRIRGYEYVDYRLSANAGQMLTVRLRTARGDPYFNILAPGQREQAFFVGSTRGNRFEGRLPATGNYTIRVYMMRSAARRGEIAAYSLAVSVTGRGNPPGRPPEGGADGPDFYRVAGLRPGDTLNLREGPGTQFRVVIQLAQGTLLRSLGCRMTESGRWCRVGGLGGSNWNGWANARYLVEASGPGGGGFPPGGGGFPPGGGGFPPGGGNNRPGDAVVPGTPYHATGPLPCRFTGNASVRMCTFGVIRGGQGTTTLDIKFPDGFTRTLLFRNGNWLATDKSDVSARRVGDTTFVTVNGSESFTIPDAVIYGG